MTTRLRYILNALLLLSLVGLWIWLIWIIQDSPHTWTVSPDGEIEEQVNQSAYYIGGGLITLCTILIGVLIYGYAHLSQAREVRTTRIEDLLSTLGRTLSAVREGSSDQLAALAKDDLTTAKEYGSFIHTQSIQLEQIVDQLQQGDAYRLQVQPRPLQLKRLLEDCIRDLSIAYGDISGQLSMTVRPEGLTVAMDPYYMKVALHHLLDNAIRYNRDTEAFHVEVTARQVANQIYITISDNGIGVEKRHLRHLGEPFFRAGREDGDTLGLGLGLHQTMQVIKAHGGKIHLSSDHTAGFQAEIIMVQQDDDAEDQRS